MALSKIASALTLTIILAILSILYFETSKMYQPKVYPSRAHISLYLDQNFDETERETIIQAALEWSEATDHIVEYDIILFPINDYQKLDPNTSVVIVKTSSTYPNIMLSDYLIGSQTLGLFSKRDYMPSIYLVTDRLSDNYKEVVLHELGHSLGLSHIVGDEGVNTLMYPYTNFGSDHITEKDLKQFCELYHCDVNNLKH